jgi:ferredoxin
MGKVMGPLAEYLDQRFDLTPDRAHLRPPGAIVEEEFVRTCYRCGTCIETCPADAIFALPDDESEVGGTPVIDPDRTACVICDGLLCTHACPSGALLSVSVPRMIRMGLAEVYRSLCVRTTGEECTLCVDRCPLDPAPILFKDSGPPEVISPGCVGCGVCQLNCPTSPKAITVRPL